MRWVLAYGMRIAHIRGCLVRDSSFSCALAQECGNACVQDVEEYRRNERGRENVCALLRWNIDRCISGEDVYVQELWEFSGYVVAEYMRL